MSYATPTQFRERIDVRMLGDLAADDGTQVSSSGVLSDGNIQAALNDGSGDIEAALRMARRYTVAQMAALAANTNFKLVRINVDLAVGYLVDRRLYGKADETLKRIMDRGREELKALADGHLVLEVDDALDAGLPSVTGPTTAQLDNLNMISRTAGMRFYPQQFLPGNR